LRRCGNRARGEKAGGSLPRGKESFAATGLGKGGYWEGRGYGWFGAI
jgi:hypothetical protein